jgi:DNA-directed RNA polymerase subunit beta'
MPKLTDFKALKLSVASPEVILGWSHGEVTKPETINYRTQKSEKDGLFCERIFGPEKDWECYCGKYKRIRYKGVVCDKCGVEVTRAIVRRERMGHIELAAPVAHIWFLRGVPSRVGLMLNISLQDLERVIYFASYIVTSVNEVAKQESLLALEKEYKSKLKQQKTQADKLQLKSLKEQTKKELESLSVLTVLSESAFFKLSMKYANVFEADLGAGAIRRILKSLNLEELINDIEEELRKKKAQDKKALKRLRLIKGMLRAKIRPEWMILTHIPIIPPDLRPMVQLDGGRYATSDINDLYRRVINRNNRLKKLIELNAPEIICRNEKRMLQESVDALIDNSARHTQGTVTASTGQKRPLKSLADMLKGKHGRFRQNLLGKRVDYSGRSVIVVGPELKLSECGLPQKMALELFRPFVINKLIERELAYNVRGAGKLIEQEVNEVWEILDEVVQEKYVLLNRAPTLHRLGIQSFRPILIEGDAIQIHPLVCSAFNADFDGDQMAVHLPLTKEAQKEAKNIMLSSKNIFKPSNGDPIAIPTKDMVLGCYWMTKIEPGRKGEGKIFADENSAIIAYQFDQVDLTAKIKVRISKPVSGESETVERNSLIDTCAGRIIFNENLPESMDFINKVMNKKELRNLISDMIDNHGVESTGEILDKIKSLGFKYSTKSGISWGMDDLQVPKEKYEILKEAEEKVSKIKEQYNQGLLTDEERRSLTIDIWFKASDKIAKNIFDVFGPFHPVYTIVDSGARGSWPVIAQLMGMRGLMANPAGKTIELPVKGSFKEGLSVLEYFISTHGARKGTADTALKTATAGYLTRRLVDVSQDIVVREDDCGDKEGINIWRADGEESGYPLEHRLIGRVILEDVKDKKGSIIAKKGDLLDKKSAKQIADLVPEKVNMRSVIACKTKYGVCKKCYGYDLGHNKLINTGEAIGIVTAQAIGEPGTQLTMRTFHTGGVAGEGDITQGLPRVEEIFEARIPKGKAVIAENNGKVVSIAEENKQKIIKISEDDSSSKKDSKPKITKYSILSKVGIMVEKGDLVHKGQRLCDGNIDLKELFETAGKEEVRRYIIREIQGIYSTAGDRIHDKHIEVIIKQMFSRVRVKDAGDTKLLSGDIVEKDCLLEENERVAKKKGGQATSESLLLGITKVALTTSSFLSAASFQETARVLIDASVTGKEDGLRGLKENVIIGKLIPAGTGLLKREYDAEKMETE